MLNVFSLREKKFAFLTTNSAHCAPLRTQPTDYHYKLVLLHLPRGPFSSGFYPPKSRSENDAICCPAFYFSAHDAAAVSLRTGHTGGRQKHQPFGQPLEPPVWPHLYCFKPSSPWVQVIDTASVRPSTPKTLCTLHRTRDRHTLAYVAETAAGLTLPCIELSSSLH